MYATVYSAVGAQYRHTHSHHYTHTNCLCCVELRVHFSVYFFFSARYYFRNIVDTQVNLSELFFPPRHNVCCTYHSYTNIPPILYNGRLPLCTRTHINTRHERTSQTVYLKVYLGEISIKLYLKCVKHNKLNGRFSSLPPSPIPIPISQTNCARKRWQWARARIRMATRDKIKIKTNSK